MKGLQIQTVRKYWKISLPHTEQHSYFLAIGDHTVCVRERCLGSPSLHSILLFCVIYIQVTPSRLVYVQQVITVLLERTMLHLQMASQVSLIKRILPV